MPEKTKVIFVKTKDGFGFVDNSSYEQQIRILTRSISRPDNEHDKAEFEFETILSDGLDSFLAESGYDFKEVKIVFVSSVMGDLADRIAKKYKVRCFLLTALVPTDTVIVLDKSWALGGRMMREIVRHG